MRLHLYICIVVFGSFRGEGDSNSVMDLSHINQDKMLPDVSLVTGQQREADENENFMIFTRLTIQESEKGFKISSLWRKLKLNNLIGVHCTLNLNSDSSV